MANRSEQRAATDPLAQTLVSVSRSLVGIAISSIERAGAPVTVTQHRVLVLLREKGELTVGDIAALIGVNQSNASRLVDRLQKLQLVARGRAVSDGRVVRVSITPQGVDVLDAVTRIREREISAVLGRLSSRQGRAAVAALAAFDEAARLREREQLEDSPPEPPAP